MNDKFFMLLRLAIGSSEIIPHIEKEEWRAIYEISQKQSLLGLVFDGIQKMSDAAKTKGETMKMDIDLLMTWMGKCRQIERRNRLLDATVAKVSSWLQNKGFRSCILKGQGNAMMYPFPFHRTSGDIDVWIDGMPSDVIRFVHSVAPAEKACYHHIDFPPINGIPVELHYRPSYLHNPLHNHRLQRFFSEHADGQFSNVVDLGDGTVAVPAFAFNVVYQLVHIYNHLFQKGIGLRQIIDYYFVIDKWHTDDSTAKTALQNKLNSLGLCKFAGAVMYVLQEVLGLPDEKMITTADTVRGRLLLEEILQGGDFGQSDVRYVSGHGFFRHNLQRLCRDWRLARCYPAEALSEPFFRIWHFLWRLKNKK